MTLSAPPAESEPGIDPVLTALQDRYDRLRAELEEVSASIRKVLTAAEICPQCGGSGYRTIRGGLYGEQVQVPCLCREE